MSDSAHVASPSPMAWRPGRLGRADLAALALCALGAGNLWARHGAGNVAVGAEAAQFVVGFALIAAAAALCLVASRLPATAPNPLICSVAIVAEVTLQPAALLPIWLLGSTGLLLTTVPFIARPIIAWALVALAGLAVAVYVGVHWWASAAQTVDVFTEIQGSTQALLQGRNPYAPVYSVFLDSRLGHPLYGSGSFDYGPAVLLLSLPARLLGDIRFTVVALQAAILGALVVWSRRSLGTRRAGPAIASLWVASPLVPYMVLLAWTDTFCVVGFAWWLVLRDRHRVSATVCLTIALASKPSMLPLMVPLLVWTTGAWRELLWAVAGTLALALPFAVWTGIPQFVYDTIGIYGDLPTRHDGVTVDGLASALGQGFVPSAVLLSASAAAVAVFATRRPRSYGDMCVLGAGLMIVLSLLAKQAFLNYYFNAAVALVFAVGAGTTCPRDAANPRAILHSFVPRRPPGAAVKAGRDTWASNVKASAQVVSAASSPTFPPGT